MNVCLKCASTRLTLSIRACFELCHCQTGSTTLKNPLQRNGCWSSLFLHGQAGNLSPTCVVPLDDSSIKVLFCFARQQISRSVPVPSWAKPASQVRRQVCHGWCLHSTMRNWPNWTEGKLRSVIPLRLRENRVPVTFLPHYGGKMWNLQLMLQCSSSFRHRITRCVLFSLFPPEKDRVSNCDSGREGGGFTEGEMLHEGRVTISMRTQS